MRCVSRVTDWKSCIRKAAGCAFCAGAAIALAACSSGVSRFDYPMLASGDADNSLTTSSLSPIPAEPIYPNGAPASASSVERRDLPPPQNQQYAAASPRRVETVPIRPQPQYQTPQRAPQPYVAAPPPQAAYRAPAPVQPQPAASKTVSVRQGDTLYKLSKRHGVSINQIKSANNLRNSRLSVGQQLIVPGSAAGAPVAAASTYKIRRGDTLSKIARANDVSVEELQRANGLSRRSILRLDQELKIPERAGATPQAVAKSKAPVRVASSGANVPIPVTNPARAKSGTAKSTPPTAEKKVAARTTSLPKPQPMAGNQFRWPARGRIVSGFGQKPNGKHNDGIDMAVPKGTSVKAAENGVVAYAGSELEPYGNLILIRHANNWVTAYAHNEKLLVKRGDTVRRGQIISKAGQSGNVSQPQLHFELRKGSKPVNPLSYMANS